ncbi:MAG: hypothetical protein C0524_05240 [Rhodobacter sp.]|nr:hypothetical protein [Rhodobacter sp.]
MLSFVTSRSRECQPRCSKSSFLAAPVGNPLPDKCPDHGLESRQLLTTFRRRDWPMFNLRRASLAATVTALLLGLAAGALTPTAAHAYYPCDRAGPGEVIIGMAPNGPGMPETPLCEYVGEGGDYGEPGPSGYWVDRFAALAWARDGAGNPTYTWSVGASSAAGADNGAMAECLSSGFSDCQLGPSVANGVIAVAVGKDDSLHADWGETVRQAEKKALRLCRKAAKGCKIEQVLESPAQWASY